MPYSLGGVTFQSKDKIKKHVQSVIKSHNIGDTITDKVLHELLTYHPEWFEKSKGLKRLYLGRIYVAHARVYSTNVLIERDDCPDGMDISWNYCIKDCLNRNPLSPDLLLDDHIIKVKAAARGAILEQTEPYRSKGMHVDHCYPRTFSRLLFLFMKLHCLKFSQIEIESVDGISGGVAWKDKSIIEQWQAFHLRLAKLRVLTPNENQKQPVYPINWSKVK
jgi:hypothetical protein